MFACRTCRWGYLFVQEILDALYPPLGHTPPKSIHLTEGAWHDLQFWDDVLAPRASCWMGMRKHMVGTKDCRVNPSLFQTELYTDASKSFGAGGIWGTEVYSEKWANSVQDIHIGALELKALAMSLEHWKHDLAQQKVLAWMDNIQAVAAINKGASRIPELRTTLLQIAKLGLQYGFEVKAKHVKGELNPADAPSRGKVKTSSQDWTFIDFHKYNHPPAEIDCCAAESGYNVQPGCTAWFSAARPVHEHIDVLVGKVLWANVPFAEADTVLAAIVAAWERDPINTQATVVVPEWPSTAWYRRYIRRKRPLFTLLHRYPAGARVFLWKNTHCRANAVKFPTLVLRLGQREPSK